MANLDLLEQLACLQLGETLAQSDSLVPLAASTTRPVDFPTFSRDNNFDLGEGTMETTAVPVSQSKEVQTSGESSRKRKAPTCRDEDWEDVKKRIIDLYPTSTLSDIMTDLEARFGFSANERQLKYQLRKWGLRKNAEGKEMRFMVRKRQERTMRQVAEPSLPDLKFTLRGEVVNPDKIDRWVRRAGFSAEAACSGALESINTPPGLRYETASESDSAPGRPVDARNLLQPASSRLLSAASPAASFSPDVAVSEMDPHHGGLTTESGSWEQVLFGDESAGVSGDFQSFFFTGLGFEAQHVTSTSLDLDSSHTSSDLATATAGTVAISGASRVSSPWLSDTYGNLSLWSSRGPLLGASPELINVEPLSLGTNAQSTLMADLPWFRLRNLLQFQDFIGGGRDIDGESGCQRRSASAATLRGYRDVEMTPLAIADRRNVLGGLLRNDLKMQTTDLIPAFTSQFTWLVPQESHGDLEGRLRLFLDPTNNRPLQSLFEMVSFFISNKILEKDKIKAFLQWVIEHHHVPRLVAFLRLDSATTRSFAANILESAVSISNTELLESLILLGLDVRPFLCQAILIEDDKFVQLLLAHVSPDLLTGNTGGGLLFKLCEEGRVDVAKLLIERGANINFIPPRRGKYLATGTALWAAALHKNLNVVRFLLDNGADINRKSDHECHPTPLGAFSDAPLFRSDRDLEIPELLLDRGADINFDVVDMSFLDYISLHNKALHRLIRKKRGLEGSVITVSDILDKAEKGLGCLTEFVHQNEDKISGHQLEHALYESINQRDYGIGATTALLHLDGMDANCPTLEEPPLKLAAIVEGDTAVVVSQLLIDAGADVDLDGILCLAIENDNFGLLELLLEEGVNVTKEGPIALNQAVAREMVEAVELLLENEVPIDAFGEHLAPIQTAAGGRSLKLVQYLIEQGADINAPAYAHRGRTALQAACLAGNVEMTQFLLQLGADVKAPAAKIDGVTAIEAVIRSKATREDREKLFRILLEKDAAVLKLAVDKGAGVVRRLVELNLPELLKLALDAGANPNHMSGRGAERRTPLQLAAEQGHVTLAKLLVEYGADINARPAPQYGRTALQAATTSRPVPNMDMICFLVEHGARFGRKHFRAR